MKSKREEWKSTFKSLNRVAFRALFSIWQPSQDGHGLKYWFWSGNGLPELFPWHTWCIRLWIGQWGFEENLESRCLWALWAVCGSLETTSDSLSPSSLDTSNSRGLLGSLGVGFLFIVYRSCKPDFTEKTLGVFFSCRPHTHRTICRLRLWRSNL